MHKSLKALAAVLVLFGAAAGISYATTAVTRTATSVLQACSNNTNGNLRLVANAQTDCRTNESGVSWNVVGPAGPQGLPGVDGKDGTNGTNGADGKDGVSPVVQQLAANDPNCPAGGVSITDATGTVGYVCNGADGAPFAGTFASQDGRFSLKVDNTGIQLRGPLSRLTLDGTGIDERADTALTIRSGGNLSIESSGTATLKGSLTNVGSGSCAAPLRVGDQFLVAVPAGAGGSYPVSVIPNSSGVCIG